MIIHVKVDRRLIRAIGIVTMTIVPDGAEDFLGTLTNATGWIPGKDLAWMGKKKGGDN